MTTPSCNPVRVFAHKSEHYRNLRCSLAPRSLASLGMTRGERVGSSAIAAPPCYPRDNDICHSARRRPGHSARHRPCHSEPQARNLQCSPAPRSLASLGMTRRERVGSSAIAAPPCYPRDNDICHSARRRPGHSARHRYCHSEPQARNLRCIVALRSLARAARGLGMTTMGTARGLGMTRGERVGSCAIAVLHCYHRDTRICRSARSRPRSLRAEGRQSALHCCAEIAAPRRARAWSDEGWRRARKSGQPGSCKR
jgi:hypothetical protein